MPEYTTRIELHNSKVEDYTALHEKLKAIGFRRRFRSGKTAFQMPQAEYNCSTKQSVPQRVLGLVVGAATELGFPPRTQTDARKKKTSSILITEATKRAHAGLNPAPAPKAKPKA